jgi:hypothetical protein
VHPEALINQWGGGKFRGFSAGSHPKGAVHPFALELLKRMKLPTEGVRSKSWADCFERCRGSAQARQRFRFGDSSRTGNTAHRCEEVE